MLLKEVVEVCELLDDPHVSGEEVSRLFSNLDLPDVYLETLQGEEGTTDVVRILIPGKNGKTRGKGAPTLGILGTLGGVGARPNTLGLVSDADGCIAALSAGLKLAKTLQKGDQCAGDVIVATHICPAAPTRPHDPVSFMESPVPIFVHIMAQLTPEMDAILSVDTTKGNRIINHDGFAISPTVKQGYILRVSEDLLTIMEWVTGDLPVVLPITTQDITPYENGIYHLNSVMQPSVVTDCPVVGVSITTRATVPGCASGANSPFRIEMAARFCVEVAKVFGEGRCHFYDEDEFARLQKLYGSMDRLRQVSNDNHFNFGRHDKSCK